MAMQDIAAFVKERRRLRGLGQRELAALAGVTQRFVSELERAKPTARIDAVERVLAVFGMQVGVLPLRRDA